MSYTIARVIGKLGPALAGAIAALGVGTAESGSSAETLQPINPTQLLSYAYLNYGGVSGLERPNLLISTTATFEASGACGWKDQYGNYHGANSLQVYRNNGVGEYYQLCKADLNLGQKPTEFDPWPNHRNYKEAYITQGLNEDATRATASAGVSSEQYGYPIKIRISVTNSRTSEAVLYFRENSLANTTRQLKELTITVRNGAETVRKIWYLT